MKLLATPLVAVVLGLVTLPALFATGDDPGLGCGADANLAAILATIRQLESGDDYTARATGSTASGAYQMLDSTWGGYGGYARAWLGPADVQDARAAELVQSVLDTHEGDVSTVPVSWYIGRVPPPGSPDWDTVPYPDAGNVLTPREYQTRWLAELQRRLTGADDTTSSPTSQPVAAPVCVPGLAIGALSDGFAYPGPAELFANAPVGEPHHDYPAWDWMLAPGTPVYAVHGGTVVSVQYWPHNWWDFGCGVTGALECRTCGIGVTVEDAAGNRWAYCHGSAVHVRLGTKVAAGAQLLSSGNTGRSGGPHLHLQVTTPDGQRRCPQPLLRALRDLGAGVDPATLPTTGCYF